MAASAERQTGRSPNPRVTTGGPAAGGTDLAQAGGGVPGDPDVSRRRRRQPALLQRTGRGAPRPPLRGDQPDAAGGVGDDLLAHRQPGPADAPGGPSPGPGPGRPGAEPGQFLHPRPRRRRPPPVGDRRPARGPGRHPPRRAGHLLGPAPPVNVVLRGVRGSLPSPRPATARYGGNTSCVEVRAEPGCVTVLDAGTGIRAIDGKASELHRVDVLLTHLHMDHILGLGFFRALYQPGLEVHLWGPPSATQSLHARLTRYP